MTLSAPFVTAFRRISRNVWPAAGSTDAAAEGRPQELLDEMDRAKVVKNGSVPADVVRMGSTVTFKSDDGHTRTLKLVYPVDESLDEHQALGVVPFPRQRRHAEESRDRRGEGGKLAEDVCGQIYRWQKCRAQRCVACADFTDKDACEGINCQRQKRDNDPKEEPERSIQADQMAPRADQLMDQRRIRDYFKTGIPARLPQRPPSQPVVIGKEHVDVGIVTQPVARSGDQWPVTDQRQPYRQPEPTIHSAHFLVAELNSV